MELLIVGIGGILGSIARFTSGKIISKNNKGSFPLGTFIINITGAIFLGIVSNISISKNLYLFLGEGFLGSYTTFSTFMYEGVNLLEGSKKLNGFIYIMLTVILGIIGYSLGNIIVHMFI
ncbi:fluoride efflux transporter CrcB [Clostridium lundense]|uniref:fluoride efflux transporter CrcB n=1 Tax=Clostridium lundense TaxID=319475 RepID=UPI00048920B9|nr:fluoride efflux transporter CrcB [Clostridium lundense]